MGGGNSGQDHCRGLGPALLTREAVAFNFRVRLLGDFAQCVCPPRMLLKVSQVGKHTPKSSPERKRGLDCAGLGFVGVTVATATLA